MRKKALIFDLERYFYHGNAPLKKEVIKQQDRIGITFTGMFGISPAIVIKQFRLVPPESADEQPGKIDQSTYCIIA